MTVAMLRDAGALVEHVDDTTWRVEPGPLRSAGIIVEPDLSNAAAFLAAAVVTGGRVTVPGWPLRTTQAGDALRNPAGSGRACELDDTGLTVRGGGPCCRASTRPPRRRRARPGDRRGRSAGRRAHRRCAASAHLRTTRPTGWPRCPRRSTRWAATSARPPTGSGHPPAPLHGGGVETYDDHRMATAAAVLGLVIAGVEVEDMATTAKTLPDIHGAVGPGC